jgi:asparagine synthase (glutamine-hydrolysing)
MFALALFDRADRSLWLARDRIGEKPLYYGWQGDAFLFGSELRALAAHPAFNAAVDRGALALMLRYSYVPSPYSIHAGIRKLPAGHYLHLRAHEREVDAVPYWSLAAAAEAGIAHPFAGSDEEAIDMLEQRLGAAVRGQLLSDVPLGALLSGGIDSTAVVALMQANNSHPIRTFTIGFEDRDYDEAMHAKTVADHLGTAHTELRLAGDDVISMVSSMGEVYDEPFADSSQLPTHLVMKLARQHVTVALSGDGGDELFGGYTQYVNAPRVWRQRYGLPFPVRKVLGAGMAALPVDAINRLARPLGRFTDGEFAGDKMRSIGHRLRRFRDFDDLYLSRISQWTDCEGLVLEANPPSTLFDDRARWPDITDLASRMMAMDGLTYLPDDILVKVDRASMAVSLETRAPMLDRDVVEFAWTLPRHMKLRAGQGKWLLRRLVDRYVPATMMERPKQGFGIPLGQWLRGPLRDWAETLLAEDRLRAEGYLDPVPVRAAWRRHIDCEADLGMPLWSVLMFQSWLESCNAGYQRAPCMREARMRSWG